MDLLKEELLKKRQSLAEETGGKRVFKRSEIQQKQIHKLREQDNRELEAKSPKRPSDTTATTAPPPSSADTASLVLPKHEVVRRLRFLKQPVTLFGEDDGARLHRLSHVLEAGLFEVDSDLTEGQTNDFLRDIAELQKTGIVRDRKRQKTNAGADADEDLKRMKANFEELCDEDKILVFFKKLLNEQEQKLHEMPEAEKRTAEGKSEMARFNQCVRNLEPLFKLCRNKVLPDDVRHVLLFMVECFMKRDYQAAMGYFLKLSIGNSPWPIGNTMVGIHERSAREKINTYSVAHIMNDETTLKYLHSVQRLLNFCQRLYPTMPSKAFEFNSLANGSE